MYAECFNEGHAVRSVRGACGRGLTGSYLRPNPFLQGVWFARLRPPRLTTLAGSQSGSERDFCQFTRLDERHRQCRTQ